MYDLSEPYKLKKNKKKIILSFPLVVYEQLVIVKCFCVAKFVVYSIKIF